MRLKNIFLILILAACSLSAQAQSNSIFQISPMPVCWNTGSVDSSLVAYWLFSGRENAPRVISYLTPLGAVATVAGGTVTFGYCGSGGGSVDSYYVMPLCDDGTPFYRLVDLTTATTGGDFDIDWQPYTPAGTITDAPCTDLEYEKVCLLDSISPGNIVTFYRFLSITTNSSFDLDYELMGLYVPTGTVLSCAGNDNNLLRRIAGNTDTTYLSTQLCVYDSLTGAYSRVVEVIRTIVAGQVVATLVVELDGTPANLSGQYLSNCGTTRTPGTLPDSCQCVYSIYQENHVVDTVFVNSRDYRVAYDVVTTRNCAGLGPAEIDRQNLTSTFQSNNRRNWFFNIQVDNILDSINLLFFNPDTVLGFTFNPSKVATRYPALLGVVDTADFRCALGNLANMQIAYDTLIGYIIQEFVTANALGPVINYSNYTVSITNSAGRCQVNIAWDVYNLPTVPYVNIPYFTNPDYYLSPGISNGGQGMGETARVTSGSYSEACSPIATSEQYFFTNLSLSTPENQILGASPPLYINSPSTITSTTCDETGPLCPTSGRDTTNVIILNNCVSICDTVKVLVVNDMPCAVQGLPEHVAANSSSVTLLAGTYNSIAIAVISGTVIVNVGGIDVTYPPGFSATWTAPNGCAFLTEPILINAAAGSAIISTLR
ncbi:MAG: hypothetical protein KF852_04180 [Saprospiraceae bacterium]|nr:hypothetical protein [Saprospiraceae bacterium]